MERAVLSLTRWPHFQYVKAACHCSQLNESYVTTKKGSADIQLSVFKKAVRFPQVRHKCL